MKINLFALLLLAAISAGCSEPPPEVVTVDPLKQMSGELNRLKNANAELSEANAKLTIGQSRLREETAALTKANFDLTKKQENLQRENLQLTSKLHDEINAKAEAMKDRLQLYKERFAQLNPAEQQRLIGYLEKLNADQPVTLTEVQALVNDGLVERDDPRYLKAKQAESAN